MNRKEILSLVLILVLGLSACLLAGCGKDGKKEDSKGDSKSGGKVVIYSNADDEAVQAMSEALDNNGFKGKYAFETFGTSELGGKILAEGKNMEADMVTMSTFYLKSAQEQNKMFADLDFKPDTLEQIPAFTAPITSQEGSIIINTDLLKEKKLDAPKSIRDLAKPEYKDALAVTDVKSSSTAWLLIQALISEYGEDEAKSILGNIYKNAGDHLETSGSAPLKLCESGEVAIGFGLRHQAVAAKEEGLPIDFVDPTEGNFSLTESVAVLDKGDKSNPLAMEIAKCIIEKGRKGLQKYYPNPLYNGESTDAKNKSANPKIFKEPLTFELYKHHQEISDSAK